jgi:multimeric flavodoxin WrbA
VALLLINGSARGDGDTGAVVRGFLEFSARRDVTVVELASLSVGQFSYGFEQTDDFPALMDKVLAHEELLIATPVYWYAMSGHAKTFLDRMTDYLMVDELKPLGRTLRGKSLSMLAVGADPELPPGFVEPFRLTAGYLGMAWRGEAYVSTFGGGPILAGELEKVRAFAQTYSPSERGRL